jgi:hypothetical protein
MTIEEDNKSSFVEEHKSPANSLAKGMIAGKCSCLSEEAQATIANEKRSSVKFSIKSSKEKWEEAAENKEIRTGTHSSLQCTLPNRET